MTVVLEHLPCTSCCKDTAHLRRGMNHAFHLIASLSTVGVWCVVWLLSGLALDRTSFCMQCGTKRFAEGFFGGAGTVPDEGPRQAEVESPVSPAVEREGTA